MQIKISLQNGIFTGNSCSHWQRKERHDINSNTRLKCLLILQVLRFGTKIYSCNCERGTC